MDKETELLHTLIRGQTHVVTDKEILELSSAEAVDGLLAINSCKQKKVSEAQDHLDKAIASHPESFFTIIARAYLEQAAGRKEAAFGYYFQSLALRPDDEPVLRRTERLVIGLLSVKRKEWEARYDAFDPVWAALRCRHTGGLACEPVTTPSGGTVSRFALALTQDAIFWKRQDPHMWDVNQPRTDLVLSALIQKLAPEHCKHASALSAMVTNMGDVVDIKLTPEQRAAVEASFAELPLPESAFLLSTDGKWQDDVAGLEQVVASLPPSGILQMELCDAYEKQQRFLDAFSAFWKASLLLMDNQRTDWQDAGLKLAARALHQAAGVEDLVGIISAELDYTGQDFVDKCKQNMSALVVDDLECVLCFNSLFRPVTTACGHVMCRACIARSLDHSPQCAMCRQPLPFFLARHQLPVTRAIESIFEHVFPDAYMQRKAEDAADQAEREKNVPIFVCATVFPGVSFPLHVFEPRYRLMLRRALHTEQKEFGMCTHTEQGYSDVGCLLKIKDFQLTPDGRAFVDCEGTRRFRVLERSMLDGYHTARIEFIEDEPDVCPEGELPLHELQSQLRAHVAALQRTLPAALYAQITSQLGPPPEDDALLPFWLHASIGDDQERGLQMLASTQLRERIMMTTSRAGSCCIL